MVSLRDGVGARCEVTVPPGVAEFRRDLETPAAEVAPLLVPVDE
jgi:hypothetical protein